MNDNTWQSLCAYSDRFLKRGNQQTASRKLRQQVDCVLDRIPRNDRAVLLSHWATATATDPATGLAHPAPLFLLESDFCTETHWERASALTISGSTFIFEMRLIHPPTPGEVIQGLIAHELAHAWLYFKYILRGLPLPPCQMPGGRVDAEYEGYRWDRRTEEALVHETVSRWGYYEESLELWETAVKEAPQDAFRYYSRLRKAATAEDKIRQQLGRVVGI